MDCYDLPESGTSEIPKLVPHDPTILDEGATDYMEGILSAKALGSLGLYDLTQPYRIYESKRVLVTMQIVVTDLSSGRPE